jgi:hypothetical protein
MEIAFHILAPNGDKCKGMELKRTEKCKVEVYFEPPNGGILYEGSLKISGYPESEMKLEGKGMN